MGSEQDGRERWISAGLAALAEGGIDQVRVEVIAARLGVTKGGFYRRFRDRRALLDAMLEEWASGRMAALGRQIERGEMGARERLRSLIDLYSARVSAHGMAIELAVRQWARTDKPAASAVARVDAQRLKTVETLYRQLGMAPDKARSTAVLFYAFIFGQSLLVLDIGPRERANIIEACAGTLTNIGIPAKRAN